MADPRSEPEDALFQVLMKEVRTSRKYRGLDLPEGTLHDLYTQALDRQASPKAAVQTVREKLHNIVAPYLGDPDYPRATQLLEEAFASGGESTVKSACLELLRQHASSRERIPLLGGFYQRLWEITGVPSVLLDLACGLHPFGLPWMGLPDQASYYAYDIHAPRVALIDHFFRLAGQPGRAIQQDILVQPPEIKADVAFFFKEAHRFEQRQRGCNRPFWQSLRVRWLLVSLPTASLTGRRDLVDRQRRLVNGILRGLPWPVAEIRFENELVFCIQKS